MGNTTETQDSGVRWQGGGELRTPEATRVGNLFVTQRSLFFIEAGRAHIGRFRGAITLAALAGLLLLIPIWLFIYSLTWEPMGSLGLKIGATVCGLLVGAGAVANYRSVLAQYESDLQSLGEPSDAPDVEMLDTLSVTMGGSEMIPLTDIDSLTPDGALLHVETRLGERFTLRVVPSPASFVEAIKAGGGARA